MDEPATDSRIDELLARLRGLRGAVVAFSGGVDSTMLLHACRRALGDRVVAVTADSPSLPRAELAEARALAAAIGVRHVVLPTRELDREGYRQNGTDRCYFCKGELFSALAARLPELGGPDWSLLYGAIADDLAEHRPGARAAAEHGVLAPLADCGLGKEDVRAYSRAHGLPTADKPAKACLASRVPFGRAIDAGLLQRIERAEAALADLGLRQFRVRHHGELARIEVAPAELPAAFSRRAELVARLRAAGYTFVTLDLQGYRSGSLHEALA